MVTINLLRDRGINNMPQFKSQARLWWDATGERLVPEGHRDAQILALTPNKPVTCSAQEHSRLSIAVSNAEREFGGVANLGHTDPSNITTGIVPTASAETGTPDPPGENPSE